VSIRSKRFNPFERRPAFVVSLLLSFVIIFGAGYIVAYKSYMKAIDATIRSNETKATLLAKLILEHQRAAIGVLQSYADRPFLVNSVKKKDFKGALKVLTDLAKNNPEMDWPFITNTHGTLWVNYPVDRQVMNRDFSYRDWYKGVSKEWKPYISGVYKLIVGEKDLAVAVSVPILDEKGKAMGILSTAQSTAFFQKIIGEVGSNLDAKITLVDWEGYIIYSNGFRYTKEIIGYPSFESVKMAKKREKANVKIGDTSDRNRMKYVSIAPIEGIGWSILVERARSEVFRSEYSYFVLIGVISLMAYGVFVLFMIRSRDRHRQIKELEKLSEELDGRVRERTAELEAGNKALRESEERLRQMIETSPVAIGFGDSMGKIFEANESFYRLTGYTREEIRGSQLGWDRLTAPEYAELDRQIMATLAAAGSAGPYEKEYIRKDGSRVPLLLSVSKLPGRDEHIAFILDITERKRAEEELRKSETKYRIVADNTYDFEFWINPRGQYIYASPSSKRITGYDAQDFIKDPNLRRRVTHPDDRTILDGHIEEDEKKQKVSRVEFRIVHADGSIRWISHACQPVFSDEGEYLGVRGSNRDITESKRVGQEIMRQNALLGGINRLFQETLSSQTQEDLGKACLSVAEEVTGSKFGFIGEIASDGLLHDIAISDPGWEFCTMHDKTGHRRPPGNFRVHGVYSWVLTGGRSLIANEPSSHPDSIGVPEGHPPLKAFLGVPLIGDGKTIGMIAVGNREGGYREEDQDALEALAPVIVQSLGRKRAEEALQQRTFELRGLTETLEQRVKERTAELAALSEQLVSAQENERRRVSYDLHDNVWQTLLAVRFEIERLFSGEGGKDWAALRSESVKLRETMLNAVGKIRSMQGDLWPYVLDDIGIVATIDWYCREFEKNHSGLAIERKSDLTEREISSSAKVVIYRILQETLSNIAKHSQARHVTIRLMKKDHGMELTVQDNGIGFDPEETIARKAPWGGLGLLSIKARTELSGGSFGVESVKGKGTTVRASWPL
jgi:PAS domain S-box-containing protein